MQFTLVFVSSILHENNNMCVVYFMRALSKFEAHDFMAVQDHLELVPGGSVTEVDRDGSSTVEVSWDTAQVLYLAQKQALRAITLIHTTDVWKDEM